jgi:hypothetical protein
MKNGEKQKGGGGRMGKGGLSDGISNLKFEIQMD